MTLSQVHARTAFETSALLARDHVLPVPEPLACLFPDAGLRRGTVLALSGPGTTSVLLNIVSSVLATGSWAAVIGCPQLGVEAASDFGAALERLALVPRPGALWPQVTATLLDAVDLVAVCARRANAPYAQRLAARARERRSVLVVFGDEAVLWPNAEIRIAMRSGHWEGLGAGHGTLRRRTCVLSATGRAGASRATTARVALPDSSGGIAAVKAGEALRAQRDN